MSRGPRSPWLFGVMHQSLAHRRQARNWRPLASEIWGTSAVDVGPRCAAAAAAAASVDEGPSLKGGYGMRVRLPPAKRGGQTNRRRAARERGILATRGSLLAPGASLPLTFCRRSVLEGISAIRYWRASLPFDIGEHLCRPILPSYHLAILGGLSAVGY